MTDEVHISGVLVHALPQRALEVSAVIGALPDAEVFAVGESGKLVVVCECVSADQTLDLIARIRELPGVAHVALVYQHAESRAAMEEEISDETEPTRVH